MNRMLGKKLVSFLKAAMAFAVVLAFFAPSLHAVDVETFDDTTASIIPYVQTANKGENNTTVCIYPYVQVVKKGETLNVSIYVEPGEPIVGINVGRLSFDPSILHLNSVTEGDIFDPYDTFTPGVINNTDGTVTGISGITSNATTDPGAFCCISFTAQEKIGTSLLDLEDVIVTNISGVEVLVIVNDGEVAIGWSVTLDFNEDSGKNDNVVFGEASTANDGQPHDSYDIPKAPPGPQLPYILAWFDDGMPEPYNFLWEDYRQYPDTEKTWNLDAKWDSNNSDPTDVTISWDMSEFNDCEYASVILTRYDPFNGGKWDFAADMLISDNYTYTPQYFNKEWLIDHFRINATDVIPPVISNVDLAASDPLDTDAPYGWENVTCTVIDTGSGVDTVKLVVTNPDMITTECLMTNIDSNTYYYNTTFGVVGCYSYYIWADDTSDNNATSSSKQFELPPNWDVDMDGECYFYDLGAVVATYGDVGPPGWVREDVDNDGEVYFYDLGAIVSHYGDTWMGCSFN